MSTESHDDGEGELLRRLRGIVSPNVPIIAVLDLQALEADPGATKGVSFTAGLELVLGY